MHRVKELEDSFNARWTSIQMWKEAQEPPRSVGALSETRSEIIQDEILHTINAESNQWKGIYQDAVKLEMSISRASN